MAFHAIFTRDNECTAFNFSGEIDGCPSRIGEVRFIVSVCTMPVMSQ